MKKLTLRAVVSEGAGMRYNKTIMLSNGVECCLRNGTESDGQLVLDNFNLTHSETDYLLTYPDENSFNAEQESQFLKEKAESEREIELIAIVDGVITGTAGIEAIGTKYKVRHRAEFGISVAKKYWGLGIVRLCWLHVSNVLKQRAIASLNLMWLLKTKEPFLCMNRLDLSSLEEIPKDFAPA